MWDFIKENSIALAAGFISLLALFFTIYHGMKTRKHFKLSVKPKLTIDFGDFEEHNYHINLKNQGFGPAIIRKFKVMEGENELQIKEPSAFTDIILNGRQNIINSAKVNLPYIDEPLASNKELTIVLIKLNTQIDFQVSTSKQLEMLFPYRMIIEYESMYGEKDKIEFPPKFIEC